MKKITYLGLAAASLLSGCANLNVMKFKDGVAGTEEQARLAVSVDQAWQKPAVLAEGKASVVIITPETIPDSIRKRKISMELDPGTTIQDVVAVLGSLGIPTILADEEVAKKSFYLPKFDGTVGSLLSTLSRVNDVWFTWHDGAMVVSAKETIAISVPQESLFADELEKSLGLLKIDTKAVQWQAGMASMAITPSQFKSVKAFLERYTANAAVITLQVAVVNVTLNQTAKQGIDWDALQISATRGGNFDALKAWNSATGNGTGGGSSYVASPTTDTGTGTGTSTGTGTGSSTSASTGVAALDKLQAIALGGGSFAGAIFSQNFSFQGLFNFLQNYGVAETQQNVLLKTIAGSKVEFKSLTQIPYVSEVGVTTTSGTNNSSSLGSTKTEKADDGITVELTPTYDAAANSVTIDLKLAIKAVVAFNELSAGNQIGKLTQPTTAERSFTDTVRLRPGQTAVVGGLNYDSVSDNRGAPVFLSGTKLESQSLTVNRQSMFIVLRPSVTKLGQVMSNDPEADSIDLMPAAKDKAPAAKASSKKSAKKAEKPAEKAAEAAQSETDAPKNDTKTDVKKGA